jgi:hypothetical protein
MGPLTCPRCGTPMSAVADRILYVQCGHRPASVARPHPGDVLDAYGRWSYGEGWTDGLADGRRQGFEDGYRAGFDAGAEVGAVRVLLALEHVLHDGLPDLLPELPHSAEYDTHRKRTAPSDSPCDSACGHCSRCIRAAAAAANMTKFGHPDLPGAEATAWTHREHEGNRRALPSARPLAREAAR